MVAEVVSESIAPAESNCMTSRKVTMADIARESGASPTTVSLVLRDKPGIGAETRDRVLAIAHELGYERKQRGNERFVRPAIALAVAIIFRVRAQSSENRTIAVNPFYSLVLSGLESGARQANMNLLFGTIAVDTRNRILDAPQHLLSQELDGIVFVGALDPRDIGTLLAGRSIPLVQVDGPTVPGAYDCVGSDNTGGMREIVAYLLGLGHRRIGLLTREVGDNPNFSLREQGYVDALRDAGLEPIISRIEGELTPAIASLLDHEPQLTAIVGVNDQFAIDVIRHCAARGIAIPDDLSIVGFDDIEHAASITPPLTTMSVDKVGMGRRAIHTLLYRRQWPDVAPACTILSPRLITRGSAAPPPGQGVPVQSSVTAHQEGA
jgi:LacI family transcriptional regulator